MINTSQKGFTSTRIIILIALLVVGVIAYVALWEEPSTQENEFIEPKERVEVNEEEVGEEKAEVSSDSEPVKEKKQEPIVIKKEELMAQYKGALLAGASAPLLDFVKADYDAALQSGKLVVLYFYANWCPTCKAEFPKMQQAFNELTRDDVIAFRVNFNDNETDGSERDLALKFGVNYQHTKVFIKGGQSVLAAPDTWDKDRYVREINTYASQ